MKLNRLIAASLVGFSLLATSTWPLPANTKVIRGRGLAGATTATRTKIATIIRITTVIGTMSEMEVTIATMVAPPAVAAAPLAAAAPPAVAVQ